MARKEPEVKGPGPEWDKPGARAAAKAARKGRAKAAKEPAVKGPGPEWDKPGARAAAKKGRR
jgi:hypothetical protein